MEGLLGRGEGCGMRGRTIWKVRMMMELGLARALVQSTMEGRDTTAEQRRGFIREMEILSVQEGSSDEALSLHVLRTATQHYVFEDLVAAHALNEHTVQTAGAQLRSAYEDLCM